MFERGHSPPKAMVCPLIDMLTIKLTLIDDKRYKVGLLIELVLKIRIVLRGHTALRNVPYGSSLFKVDTRTAKASRMSPISC